MDDDDYERRALDIQDRIAAMSDVDLKAAYMASETAAGEPVQDALLAELEARGIEL